MKTPVVIKISLTWSGVNSIPFNCAYCIINATAPDTCGVACDVPDNLPVVFPAFVLKIETPGASTSINGPKLLNPEI